MFGYLRSKTKEEPAPVQSIEREDEQRAVYGRDDPAGWLIEHFGAAHSLSVVVITLGRCDALDGRQERRGGRFSDLG